MKNLSLKSKIYLSLQIFFMLLTGLGFVLLLTGILDNAGMSVVCMVFSLTFGNFFQSSREKH